MLLSGNPNTILSPGAKAVVVISQRENVRAEIAQLLRTQGMPVVKEMNQDFFSSEKLSFDAEKISGIVIDIEQIDDVESTVNAIYGLIPQAVWCCLVGDSDSISTAQQFLNRGVLYFHLQSQKGQMVRQILSGLSIPRVRTTINISVLACKGGVGASFISAHLANLIAENKKIPVLLAQDSRGSQDLDLLFDKRIQNEVTEFSDFLDLFSGDLNKLKETALDKYNFILHDKPLFSALKEQYATYLQESNNFILVIERKMHAIRLAKSFLDECNRAQQADSKPRRVFICINDHNAETAKLMATTDIERLLGHSVDTVFPLLKKTSGKVLSVDIGKSGKKALTGLVQRLLGASSKQHKKRKSLFVSLFRTLSGK
ncbi:pilus assembly protein CpaE [Pasteurella testudinis DSM 23072]|uniref:Pilus assembly protein CpaE n=1 Tax=Pasteurella testudinis DSM 23072 TaxID=1122938 RepID=A0A1W1UD55_9PAST|nr:pilus assembly protein [Pasteurella testudinis]SMB78963.1 pilus assembly protein CpaE [Pasteurella testudinis DSM 23072]SUB52451.1 flp operon protein D [Pasteurella testudinis]